MHPKELSIDDFTYDLPADKIALYPVHPRDSSRLLVYKKGMISEDIYRNIEKYLPDQTTLVFNDTRVIKSRILFPKTTGAVIEIFCLEPYEQFIDYETLFQQRGSSLWKCMIGKAGKWRDKFLTRDIVIGDAAVTLRAELIKRLADSYVVKFDWTPAGFTLGEILTAAGVTPLPPYIKRTATKDDEKDYQTVYSVHKGSVAAPTAGLHFSEAMMASFHKKGIATLFTTLHVGAGTFKPVKSPTMEGHIMHEEWINISVVFLQQLLANLDHTIVSVGTTSTRTLESIYWMGNKILNDRNITPEALKISQWEVYDSTVAHDPQSAVQALLHWIVRHDMSHLLIETGIIIAPGYQYKIVSGLVTNFHQPKSTLLLLVAAFMGSDWITMYDYALTHNFRFLSYGDGCLIIP